MVQKIDSYKSIVEMDAKPYVDAAKAGEDAAKKFADADEKLKKKTSASLNPSVDKSKVISDNLSEAAFTRRLLAFDRQTKAQDVYRRNEEFANKALAAGNITEEQKTRLLSAVASKYRELGVTLDKSRHGMDTYGDSTKFTRTQILNLQYTISDVVASLASGASPLTILMQQGGQVAQAFGGLRGTFASFLSVIGPVRLGLSGISTLMLGMAFNSEKNARFYGDLENRLKAVGDRAAMSSQQIRLLVDKTNAMPGVSANEAKTTVADLIFTAHVAKSMYGDLIDAARKYAVLTGTDLPQALHTLATGFKNTSSFARELQSNVKGFEGFSYSVYSQIDSLEKAGKHYEAQKLLLGELQEKLSNVRTEGVTPLQISLDKLSVSWQNLRKTSEPMVDFFGGTLANALAFAVDKANWAVNRLTQAAIMVKLISEYNTSLLRGEFKGPQIQGPAIPEDILNPKETGKPDPGPGALERQTRAEEAASKEQSKKMRELLSQLTASNEKRMKGLGLIANENDELVLQTDSLRERNDLEGQLIKDKYKLLRLMDEYGIKNKEERSEIIKRREELLRAYLIQEKSMEQEKKFEDQLKSASATLSKSLAQVFVEGRSAGDMFRQFYLQMVEDLVAKTLSSNLLDGLFSFAGKGLSSIGFGETASFLFGGGHASGGSVTPGHYYTVGENGPETLYAGSSGSIVPNTRRGGDMNVSMNINVSGPAASGGSASAQAASLISSAVRSEMKRVFEEEKRAGGQLWSAA